MILLTRPFFGTMLLSDRQLIVDPERFYEVVFFDFDLVASSVNKITIYPRQVARAQSGAGSWLTLIRHRALTPHRASCRRATGLLGLVRLVRRGSERL